MIKTLSVIIVTSLLASTSLGITRVGNGGDVVYCESGTSGFSGHYSYDFLATYNLKNQNSDIVPVGSIEESIARLEKVIARVLPRQLDEFKAFMKNRENYHDQMAPHFWQLRPGALIDVPNLPHVRELPRGCDEVHQAVIHYALGDQDIYEVNGEVLDAIKVRPLQWSFLLVHEFLWGVFEELPASPAEAQKRFEFTRFLHSRAALEWESVAVFKHLSNLGVAPTEELFYSQLSWAEKYDPPATRVYHCSYKYWTGQSSQFVLQFSGLSYLGSSGGYFYDNVELLSLDRVKESALLARPANTEGLYVFEGGFNFQLQSLNPLDGSFENNMSETMHIFVSRGSGQCHQLAR